MLTKIWRVYANWYPLGRDFATREDAMRIAAAYQQQFPRIRYRVRAVNVRIPQLES